MPTKIVDSVSVNGTIHNISAVSAISAVNCNGVASSFNNDNKPKIVYEVIDSNFGASTQNDDLSDVILASGYYAGIAKKNTDPVWVNKNESSNLLSDVNYIGAGNRAVSIMNLNSWKFNNTPPLTGVYVHGSDDDSIGFHKGALQASTIGIQDKIGGRTTSRNIESYCRVSHWGGTYYQIKCKLPIIVKHNVTNVTGDYNTKSVYYSDNNYMLHSRSSYNTTSSFYLQLANCDNVETKITRFNDIVKNYDNTECHNLYLSNNLQDLYNFNYTDNIADWPARIQFTDVNNLLQIKPKYLNFVNGNTTKKIAWGQTSNNATSKNEKLSAIKLEYLSTDANGLSYWTDSSASTKLMTDLGYTRVYPPIVWELTSTALSNGILASISGYKYGCIFTKYDPSKTEKCSEKLYFALNDSTDHSTYVPKAITFDAVERTDYIFGSDQRREISVDGESCIVFPLIGNNLLQVSNSTKIIPLSINASAENYIPYFKDNLVFGLKCPYSDLTANTGGPIHLTNMYFKNFDKLVTLIKKKDSNSNDVYHMSINVPTSLKGISDNFAYSPLRCENWFRANPKRLYEALTTIDSDPKNHAFKIGDVINEVIYISLDMVVRLGDNN